MQTTSHSKQVVNRAEWRDYLSVAYDIPYVSK